MPDNIPQFGDKPEKEYKERLCAYVVVFNDEGKILAVKIGTKIVDGGLYHLLGGGINEDEDPKDAVVREAIEEAGCDIADLQLLGKANQFVLKSVGPVNKLATFYKAKMVRTDQSKKVETDHETYWFTPDEFINGSSSDFQKWAVKRALI